MSLLLLMDDESGAPAFDPVLTPNFLWWFDDNDAVPDGIDPTKLGSIPDKLGGAAIKGGNSTLQPDINTRTLNSRKVANFVRISDVLGNIAITQNIPDFTNLGDYTMIQLIDWDIVNADGMGTFQGHQGGSGTFGIRSANFANFMNFGFGSNGSIQEISLPRANVGPHICIHRREGTKLEAWIDGTTYGTNNTGANVRMTHGYLYGREEASGGRGYFDGGMPEQRCFQRALTLQEINNHCNHIKSVWGNTVPWTNI